MTICTQTPEADAKLLRPPDAVQCAKMLGEFMDKTVLWPFGIWLAYVSSVRKPAAEDA
jgi:hypothetical protein